MVQGILVKVSEGQVEYAIVEFDGQGADFLISPDETGFRLHQSPERTLHGT